MPDFHSQLLTPASWLQGQITKIWCGKNFSRGKAFLSVTHSGLHWGALPWAERPPGTRYVPSSSFAFVSWTYAVVCGLSLKWMEAFLIALFLTAWQSWRAHPGLVAARQRCGLLVPQGLVSPCHAREDKELVLWTLVTSYKLRVETCILSNILCGSGHMISKGQVLDLFVLG